MGGIESEGMSKTIAFENEILRGLVGSTAHGTAIDGQDDRDEMAVFIEPPENVCGLTPCDHYIYRDKPDGVRSEAGDLDLTMYSLRKFCRLAEQGNPSILLLLWLPSYIKTSPLGHELVELRDAFISQDAGKRFLGYLISQRMRLTGERTRTVNRPELVAKYGYDTKFAMHALRLGLQGIELLTDGSLTMPVPEPNLSTLRAVRGGKISYDDALTLILDAETRLKTLIDACAWRSDRKRINEFMVSAHSKHWASSRLSSTVERRSVEAETMVQFHQPGP